MLSYFNSRQYCTSTINLRSYDADAFQVKAGAGSKPRFARAFRSARSSSCSSFRLALRSRSFSAMISKACCKLAIFLQNLQIFGGLVLGCIKTKFCKKITKYAFDSIFQALQDLHPFAPLQSQNFAKNRFEKSEISVKIQQIFANHYTAKFTKCCRISKISVG